MIYINISGFGRFRSIQQVEKQPWRQQVSKSTHTTENRSLLSGLFSQTETHLWLTLTQKHFCLIRVTQRSDCSGWFTRSVPWSSSPTDSGRLMSNETPEQTLQILWKNLACRGRKSQLRMSPSDTIFLISKSSMFEAVTWIVKALAKSRQRLTTTKATCNTWLILQKTECKWLHLMCNYFV